MMGAEESGGFGFGMHLPERDGIYADLLLLDLFLRERARRSLAGVEGDRRTSTSSPAPSFYRRIDVHVDRADLPRDEAAAAGRPGRRRRRRSWPASRSPGPSLLDTNDGFKFFLADGSWLLIRASGTEPLVRVYTEATSRRRCATRCSSPASAWSAAHERRSRRRPVAGSTSRGATS